MRYERGQPPTAQYHALYGYDPAGNRLYKQDLTPDREDRGEVYVYDERNRLRDFQRGEVVIDQDGNASIPTRPSDTRLPGRQQWPLAPPAQTAGLDRRGNWASFDTELAGVVTQETRSANVVNEYGPAIATRNGNRKAGARPTYDANGNLTRVERIGDCNCDGAVDFDDINYYDYALLGEEAWKQYYRDHHGGQNPPCPYLNADCDDDADVDGDDGVLLAAFVQELLRPIGRVLTHDAENRLTAVARPDGTPLLEISYDALGRRVLSKDYSATALEQCSGGTPVPPAITRHILLGPATIEEYVGCDDGQSVTWSRARDFVWGRRWPEPLVLIETLVRGSHLAPE